MRARMSSSVSRRLAWRRIWLASRASAAARSVLTWRVHSATVCGSVGAENLRHQAIFVNHAPGAIAPLDPELIQIRDAVGQLP